MNTKLSTFFKVVVASGIAIAASSSHASLIGGTLQNLQGTGLGTVSTLLTIQSPGNSTTETGSVAWNGSSDVRTGDFQPGASQTLTRTIGDAGITSAANLRLVFNPVEPQNAADSTINLNNLVLSFFSPTGLQLFNSGIFSARPPFNATDAGTGNAGFVFQLDAAQAGAAQAAAFSGTSFGQNRIGLSASASNATGGPDTFFIANFTGAGGPGAGGPGGGSTAVPEPGTLAIIGLGLAALGAIRRRRKR